MLNTTKRAIHPTKTGINRGAQVGEDRRARVRAAADEKRIGLSETGNNDDFLGRDKEN